jgi:hypothetical protein
MSSAERWKKYWEIVLQQGYKKCSCCFEDKALEQFSKKKDGKFISQCKECEKIRGKDKLLKKTSTLEGKLITLLYGVTRRCKKKKLSQDINLEYLLQLYEKQNGCCFYTGKQMSIIGNGSKDNLDKDSYFYKISIDRVNSSKGYEKNNIVLCCVGINIMKQDLPLEMFLDFCNSIISNTNNLM